MVYFKENYNFEGSREGPTFSRGVQLVVFQGVQLVMFQGGPDPPILPLDLRMPHRIQPYSYCSEFTNWLKGICTRKSVDQDHVAPSWSSPWMNICR